MVRTRERKAPRPRPKKGSDLEYGLNIDFWQAIKGTQVKLGIVRRRRRALCAEAQARKRARNGMPRKRRIGQREPDRRGHAILSWTCPRCEGTGRLRDQCSNCHGDGRISSTENVEVRIPPGAQSGSRLRVAGKGNAGTYGAPPGDLYITIRTEPHPFFQRSGDDIEISAPVRIDEAGLGTKIEVPTIDGRALLKIPQGTRNGKKFRLREKGVLNSRTNKRGDQIVEVEIAAPKVQDERTKELLREYALLNPEDPRAEMDQGLNAQRTQSRLHDLGRGRAIPDSPADAATI